MNPPEQEQAKLITQQQQIKSTPTFTPHPNTCFTYNNVPSTKLNPLQQIPLSVHYTPFDEQDMVIKRIKNMEGMACQQCGAAVNKECKVMRQKKSWVCCICKFTNQLRQPQLLETAIFNSVANTFQIELLPSPISRNSPQKYESIYIFVVDLCVAENQMQTIKASIIEFIKHYQVSVRKHDCVNVRIGLITYSKFVYLYELNARINSVVSIGSKNKYESWDLLELLGLPKDQSLMGDEEKLVAARFNQIRKKYLVSITDSGDEVNRAIKKISNMKAEGDTLFENTPKRQRPYRAFGQALNISLCLAELIPFETRVVNFVGGPCTQGVGKIINQDFKEHFRSLNDVDKGDEMTKQLMYFESAKKFYSSLKEKCLSRGTTIDIFSFSLEEVGITELSELIRVSGGYLVIGQEFSGDSNVFIQSFRQAYISISKEQQEIDGEPIPGDDGEPIPGDNYGLNEVSGLSSIVSILCSKQICINGALGQCHPLKNFSLARPPGSIHQMISQTAIGFGNINAWYLGVVDLYRTITFIFQLSSDKTMSENMFMQFKTFYTDCYGRKIVRITTAKREFHDSLQKIVQGFDQEAAVVTLARLYIHKQLYGIKRNNRKWLDKVLIRLTQKYSNYRKGDSLSFHLPPTLKFLPQYLYNFRKNPIFRRSGTSLDELYYHIYCLNHYSVGRCLTIIQPALLSYSVENPQEPMPVPLDQKYMKQNVILLLDSYFNVVLWEGESVTAWKEEGYHKKPEYEHIKRLIEAPQTDIQCLLDNRFPYPGLHRTCPGHSKQRFLKSKVSPTRRKTEIEYNQNMLTEEIGLDGFMQTLIDIIVHEKYQ